MNTSTAVGRFASLLERHLPPIEDVHLLVCKGGFAAWQVFVDERLKIVDDAIRANELKILLSCCREEFCNFARYSRNLGGDGLILPELQRLRASPSAARADGVSYLLESDARMRADLTLAKQYAQSTGQRFSTELSVERRRYFEEALRLANSRPGISASELAVIHLQRRFGEAGFAPQASRGDSACFKKMLAPSAELLVCLDHISRLGNVGWHGELPIASYVRGPRGLEAGYQRTCCQHTKGLPLRVHGLAPGAEAYGSGAYFLPTSVDTTDMGDVITLVVSETPPESSEELALVLAQVAVAADCFLTFLGTVESSVAAACTEFAKSA